MDVNKIISKRHIKMAESFNQELKDFAVHTQEDPAYLYEDQYTSFTLCNVRIEDGYLCYEQDGVEEKEPLIKYDEMEDEYYETDYNGVTDYLKYWRACLRRAKRYFSMSADELDKIQDPESGVIDE